MKIGFIGLGNMSTAIIQGLKNSNAFDMNKIYAYRRNSDTLNVQCQTLGIHSTPSPQALIDQVDIVFLGVKPEDLQSLDIDVSNSKLVSMAAKTSISSLTSIFGATEIIRIMPNLNVAFNLGTSAYCTSHATPQFEEEISNILNLIGNAYKIEENQMSAFIALAGSSPALIYRFANALAESVQDEGFDFDTALQIVSHTLIGSATSLLHSDDTPLTLVNKVASKGGTTRAGLDVFDALHFDDIISKSAQAIIKKDKLG